MFFSFFFFQENAAVMTHPALHRMLSNQMLSWRRMPLPTNITCQRLVSSKSWQWCSYLKNRADPFNMSRPKFLFQREICLHTTVNMKWLDVCSFKSTWLKMDKFQFYALYWWWFKDIGSSKHNSLLRLWNNFPYV